MSLAGVDLDALSRKELQSLCKEHGVKANGKTVHLLQQLKELQAGSDDAPAAPVPADADGPAKPAPASAKRKPKASKARAEPARPSKRSKKQQPPSDPEPATDRPSPLALLASSWCVVHNDVAASRKDEGRFGTIVMVGGACFVGGLPFRLTGSGVAPPVGHEDNQLCPDCVTENEKANAADPSASIPIPIPIAITGAKSDRAAQAVAAKGTMAGRPSPGTRMQNYRAKMVGIGITSDGTDTLEPRGHVSDMAPKRVPEPTTAPRDTPPATSGRPTPPAQPVARVAQLGAPTPFRGGLLNRGVPGELISGFGARMARTPPKPAPMVSAFPCMTHPSPKPAMGRSGQLNAPSSAKVAPVSSSPPMDIEMASLGGRTMHCQQLEQVAAFKPSRGLARTPPPTYG